MKGYKKKKQGCGNCFNVKEKEKGKGIRITRERTNKGDVKLIRVKEGRRYKHGRDK
jgi:hypothetical protein